MTAVLDMGGGTEHGELLEYAIGLQEADPAGDEPNVWLGKWTGEYAWSTQREIWQAVDEHNAVAVLSCNDSGKTWLAARVIVRFVQKYAREGCRVVTTAPTAAQVALLLWQEVQAAYDKAKTREMPIPGRILRSPYPHWRIGSQTVAFGRKPADSAQSAMQGVHEKHVLAVLDEAGGLPQSIWDAVYKITTNDHAHILAIGNPDDPTAPFADVTAPESDWRVIRIDGLRTPNMTELRTRRFPLMRALMVHEHIPFADEQVPERVRDNLLTPRAVEDRLVRWAGVRRSAADDLEGPELGEHVAKLAAQSQLFVASMRGEFPDGGTESVIPLGWIKRAQERWHDWIEQGKPLPLGRRIAGVDVATPNGADDTTVAIRAGHVIEDVYVYPVADTQETADKVVTHLADLPRAVGVVDVIGIGGGVRDRLRALGVATVGFNASSQSDRTTRDGQFVFLNDRAAGWWRLREMLDPAYGAELCLPDTPEIGARLRRELSAPKWIVRTGKGVGRIQVESKDDIRKRLTHSTDLADACIHAVWVDGPQVKPQALEARRRADPLGAGTGTVPYGSKQRALSDPGTGIIPYRHTDPGDE